MSTNTYTNAKIKLRGTQTIYTAPVAGTSIIKSIRVTNTDENTDRTVSLFITDGSSIDFYVELNRTIQKKSSQEILAAGNLDQNSADSSVSSPTPLILKSSEVLKATTTGSDIELVASILEMT
mgnify:FL=1|jgi:hypothetical protein|tara:strand:+ start:641 stop:1009 length:369 start_codon:yes stop_codon:yes gene_type:complete